MSHGGGVGLLEFVDEGDGIFLSVGWKRDEVGGDVQRLVGASDGGEVVTRGESGVAAVALPFVLDEPGVGVEVEGVLHNVLSDGRGVLAGLVEASLLALWPETVNDEGSVASGAALVGVAGVGGAEVGSPGKGEEVVVEFAGSGGLGVILVAAACGSGNDE